MPVNSHSSLCRKYSTWDILYYYDEKHIKSYYTKGETEQRTKSQKEQKEVTETINTTVSIIE